MRKPDLHMLSPVTILPDWYGGGATYLCVCVCVFDRVTEKERETERLHTFPLFFCHDH